MPELLPQGLPAKLRRAAPLFICALSTCALPTRSPAQTVPTSLRACTAEPDPGRRLACYDREMARLSPSPPGRPTAPTPREPDRTSEAAPAQAAHAPNSTTAAAAAAGEENRSQHRKSRWNIFAGGPSRVTARVARLDRSPDAMVLHLDNGQVWRQVGRASGDLSLKAGDSVTIERHLGSYWLSSRYVSNMQVRQEPR